MTAETKEDWMINDEEIFVFLAATQSTEFKFFAVRSKIESALKKLSGEQQNFFHLHYQKGMKLSEAAKNLKINFDEALAIKQGCIRKIESELGEDGSTIINILSWYSFYDYRKQKS